MKHFLLPLLFPCLIMGLFACGSASPAGQPAEVPADATFYSPMLASTDTSVTVCYQGRRVELPLAQNYMLHGKEGDTPRGEISKDSLFKLNLSAGKITDLTWLVGAQGWRSIVSDNYVVYEIQTLASGNLKFSVINEKGTYLSDLILPKDVIPVDENGATDLSFGDVIRTAVLKESADGKNTVPVLYVTKHSDIEAQKNSSTPEPDLWDTLTDTQKATRQKVVDYMTAMAELEWSPSERIYYDDFGGVSAEEIKAAGFTGTPYYADYRTKYEFTPGTVYNGLPYTHQFGNYERMAQYVDNKGILQVAQIPDDFGTKILGQSNSDWNGWMGWDCYLGTDCSGSVYSAWSQVSDVVFDSTGNEIPSAINGIFYVGDVKNPNGDTAPQDIVAANDAATMYESYAKVLPGDAMLYKGHTLLVASSATVYRNADGSINPFISSVLITDIQRIVQPTYTSDDGKTYTNTQWRVRRRVPFISLYLYKGGCLMLTNEALQNGVTDFGKPEVSLKGFLDGTVTSPDGYRILSVTVTLAEGGKELWKHTQFCVGADRSVLRYHRFVRTAYKLSELQPDFDRSGVTLEAGKDYTFTVTAKLSTGTEATLSLPFRK